MDRQTLIIISVILLAVLCGVGYFLYKNHKEGMNGFGVLTGLNQNNAYRSFTNPYDGETYYTTVGKVIV